MTITAKRAGRIDVWPSYEIAEQADIEASKFLRRMTIWPTSRQARENAEFDGGGALLLEDGGHLLLEDGGKLLLE